MKVLRIETVSLVEKYSYFGTFREAILMMLGVKQEPEITVVMHILVEAQIKPQCKRIYRDQLGIPWSVEHINSLGTNDRYLVAIKCREKPSSQVYKPIKLKLGA